MVDEKVDGLHSKCHPLSMPLPMSLQVPGNNPAIKLCAAETTIFVGANGSGKSRLAAWIEEQAGLSGYRISAHRALSLNPGVTKTSQQQSSFFLRSGINQTGANQYPESNIPAYRISSKYNSEPATFLQSDFDALLQWLYAEQNNLAVRELNRTYAGEAREPADTKFKQLRQVWERVLPTKRLIVSADDIQVQPADAGEDARYSAAHMSDGERAIFYMIGQVLFAPTGVIIFDEPELHVHRAVLGRLWDELLALRADCAFVLVTHDLEFAAIRPGHKFVVRSFTPPGIWTIERVPEDTGFDEQTATLILGSRQPILFVEGQPGSLDTAIYQASFPSWTVLPRGACEIVIHSVATMRANSSLHKISCAGLIDADGRDETARISLENQGVWLLPVSEIENLFALPAVSKAILLHNSYAEPQLSAQLGLLANTVIADAIKPENLEDVVVRHARRDIDRKVKRLSFEAAKTEAQLVQAFGTGWATIDVAAIAQEARLAIQNAAVRQDLPALLKLYDRKGLLLDAVARHLGQQNRTAFVAWVSRVLKDVNRPEVLQAIEAALPTPIAA